MLHSWGGVSLKEIQLCHICVKYRDGTAITLKPLLLDARMVTDYKHRI
jgi:hypothetical protein